MICPVYTGMSSPHRNYQNMYHFWPILTKKRYPQKYARPKWCILVLLRKSKTKKRLANHRNPLEEFSICPVYAGMNLSISGTLDKDMASAPYTRGWAIPGWFCSRCWCIRAPCTRGWTVCVRIVGKESSDLPPYMRGWVRCTVITKICGFWGDIDPKVLSAKYI